MARSVPRPRQDRSAPTRARIVDGALRLFAERGYDGVGVRDIAAALGVNHGLITYHFGGKEQLWREAVRLLFERMAAELAEPPDELALEPVERFTRRLRRYVRYCARHPEHARLMVQESTRDNEHVAWAAETFIRPSHDAVAPLIEQLMADGVLPETPTPVMIYMLSAAAQMIYALAPELKHTHGLDAFSDELIDAHADAMVRAFLRR